MNNLKNLKDRYLNGEYSFVWNMLNTLDISKLDNTEVSDLHMILLSILERIDLNFKRVKEVLIRNGYQYKNYGDINSYDNNYLYYDRDLFFTRLCSLSNTIDSKYRIPLIVSAFFSYYKVLDFRGEFPFEVPVYLDAFFIESPQNESAISKFIFEASFHDEIVDVLWISPDLYVKENESGDLGLCIQIQNRPVLDSKVVNLYDDFNFTFIDYLRFCFEWACLPNLYWASDIEKEHFLPIVEEVRSCLIEF